MMTKFLAIFFVMLSSLVSAQTEMEVKKQLTDIHSSEDLNGLIDAFPNWEIAMMHLSKDDIGEDLSPLFTEEMGTIVVRTEEKTGATYLFKSIEMDQMNSYRAKHIYFDGRRMHKEEIDKHRNQIIQEYRNGTSFTELYKKYAIHQGQAVDGDVGWFKEMTMAAAYEEAVKSHQKGDVFSVDIPSHNWYYLVLKTHDNRVEYKLSVICVKVENK